MGRFRCTLAQHFAWLATCKLTLLLKEIFKSQVTQSAQAVKISTALTDHPNVSLGALCSGEPLERLQTHHRLLRNPLWDRMRCYRMQNQLYRALDRFCQLRIWGCHKWRKFLIACRYNKYLHPLYSNYTVCWTCTIVQETQTCSSSFSF